MPPDKTNTQPDPVKLVDDLIAKSREYAITTAAGSSIEVTLKTQKAEAAAKAALLAEFTRLAALRPAPSLQGLAEKCDRLEKAVRWALGEDGEFKPFNEGYKRYWWRPELRERAFQGQPTEPKCTCRTLDVGPNGGPYGNGHAEYCGWGRANPKAPAPTPSETLTAPVDDAELFEDYDSAMSQYERSSGAVARTETWARVKDARLAIISSLQAAPTEAPGTATP